MQWLRCANGREGRPKLTVRGFDSAKERLAKGGCIHVPTGTLPPFRSENMVIRWGVDWPGWADEAVDAARTSVQGTSFVNCQNPAATAYGSGRERELHTCDNND